MARTKSTNLGDRFGKLVVTRLWRERRESGEGWKYLCEMKCDCGGTRISERGQVQSGKFNGECLACSGNAGGKKTHGHSMSRKDKDPIGYSCYTRWQSMKRRCYKEYDSHYKNYGARGIQVCERWLNSYENFLEDMGFPPSQEYQIDRIDNDGDYEPSNCRWVSRTENSRNKSNNRMITANGETKTLSAWSESSGIKRETIAMRLNRGYSPEDAISHDFAPNKIITPLGEFKSISECSRATGLSVSGVHNRIKSKSFPDWHK